MNDFRFLWIVGEHGYLRLLATTFDIYNMEISRIIKLTNFISFNHATIDNH